MKNKRHVKLNYNSATQGTRTERREAQSKRAERKNSQIHYKPGHEIFTEKLVLSLLRSNVLRIFPYFPYLDPKSHFQHIAEKIADL
jgi:hypothetical protein